MQYISPKMYHKLTMLAAEAITSLVMERWKLFEDGQKGPDCRSKGGKSCKNKHITTFYNIELHTVYSCRFPEPLAYHIVKS